MDSFLLLSRSVFKDKDDKSSFDKHVCPVENTSGPPIIPLVGNLTYHQFSVILAGACAILSALIVAVVIAVHATNYSNPVQQRQVIRILLLVPWVALFAWLTVWQQGAGEYLVRSLDFGCAIALSSFLLFMCDLVLSHPGGYDDLFGQGALSGGTGDKKSPPSLRRMWYSVLQYIPMATFIWLGTVITLAAKVYCKPSNSPHFAHIWFQVLSFIVPTIAILNSLRFYGQHKVKLQQHKIVLKLCTFKGIIGLNAIQTFIIGILAGQNVLKPTEHMTYTDLDTGLASLMLSCEMPIFAILLFFAFPVAPYKEDGPAAGPMSAIVDAFNITDLLSAFVRGPMRLVRDQQRQILRQNSVRVGLDEGTSYSQSYDRSYSPSSEEYNHQQRVAAIKASRISHAV